MSETRSRRTVIFAGGGTGGHLFPGIAVARELRDREPDSHLLFVGSQKPIELEIVRNAGFEHVALPSVSPSLSPLRVGSSLVANWRAFWQAQTIVARERPCVIVGLGGFASVPPVLAAWKAHVPVMLLEQNVIPGKATRWLCGFADVVCLPWADTAKHFSTRINAVVTGNPIRREIVALIDRPHAPAESPTLLILGGSQGATSLNAAVLEALAALRTELAGWQIVHQTGAAEVEAVRSRYAALSLTANVQSFLSDMAGQYRHATVVISRAGATTLAELACAGVPTILVPLATSAHDHQRLNARMFADQSAALMVEPTTSVAASLRDSLSQLLNDRTRQSQLGQNLRNLAQPEAALAVVKLIEQIRKP